MAIPHTYRRGAIYWFRKVLRLSDGRRLDIRLSMDTARPAEARVASQVLAVATPGVTRMLNDKLSRERWLTDDDLRLMANAAYQQTLAQLRTAERKTPLEVETVLAPVWVGMHDLLSLVEADPLQALALERLEPKLREFGFDEGRLQNLRHIADLTGGGATAVTIEMVDQQLYERGYALTDRNRLAARLAMIPAVKDAYAVALYSADPVSVPAPQMPAALVGTPPAANPSQPADPLTISEAMEACISFRRGANELSDDSLAQIRQAVGLFVFANSDLRIAELRQAHAGRFVNLMTQLPKNYGRTREELAGGLPASLERAKKLDPDKVGLSGQTRNKHITWVENVIDHARKHLGVRPSEPVDFKELRSKEAKGSTLPRVPWHDHEIKTMLQAPPWFGCAGPGVPLGGAADCC